MVSDTQAGEKGKNIYYYCKNHIGYSVDLLTKLKNSIGGIFALFLRLQSTLQETLRWINAY